MSAALVAVMVLAAGSSAATETPGLIQRVFAASPDAFRSVLEHADQRRVQVLVTEIGTPTNPRALIRHQFRSGAEYLYPASALKPAAAIAAVEAIQASAGEAAQDIDLKQRIMLAPVLDGDRPRRTSLAVAIRKTLIVSSNTAYNHLYEVAGQEGLNRSMWNAGLTGVRLNHRLSRILSVDDNRRTPAWTTRQHGADLQADSRHSRLDLLNRTSKRTKVGQAYIERGKRVEAPMDFSHKNHMSLRDLQDMLLLLIRPDTDHGLKG